MEPPNERPTSGFPAPPPRSSHAPVPAVDAATEALAPAELRVTPLQLFVAFGTVGALGFGGALPWARWVLVDRRRWYDNVEFLNTFALCNFLPGANVVNMSVVVGARLCGLPGSVAALTGLVLPPAIVVVVLASVYERYSYIPEVQSMLKALSAAAAGLIIALGVQLIRPLLRTPRALTVIAAVLVAALVFRMSLFAMLALILPASLLAAKVMRT